VSVGQCGQSEKTKPFGEQESGTPVFGWALLVVTQAGFFPSVRTGGAGNLKNEAIWEWVRQTVADGLLPWREERKRSQFCVTSFLGHLCAAGGPLCKLCSFFKLIAATYGTTRLP
jgi:hypothetical protein